MQVPADSVVVIYSRNGEEYALRITHTQRLTVLECMKHARLYNPRRSCRVNGMRAPHRTSVPAGSVVVLGSVHRGSI